MTSDQLKLRIRTITLAVTALFLAIVLGAGIRIEAAVASSAPPRHPVPSLAHFVPPPDSQSRPPSVRDGPGRFRWPLEPAPAVVRPFDPPPTPYAAGHRGVDLAAAPGAPVLAAADGVVVFAGRVVDREVVAIAHDGGLRTTYEPVVPSVSPGQRVRAGDRIGVVVAGHRGCPAAACLHWGLRREEVYLDPLLALVEVRVRLLPH